MCKTNSSEQMISGMPSQCPSISNSAKLASSNVWQKKIGILKQKLDKCTF